MSKKKKLLIALLSVACVTAGAIGISACNDEETTTPPPPVQADKVEVQSAEIDENGNLIIYFDDGTNKVINNFVEPDTSEPPEEIEISKVEINEDGDVEITYSDGQSEVYVMPKTYTAYAVDQNGRPIADVYFKLYYMGSAPTYTNVVLAVSKTNERGIATFSIEPEEGITYRVGLADHGETESDPSIPSTDYELDLGENDFGLAITYVNFNSDREAEVTFNYQPNRFTFSATPNINYKRVYNADDPDNPTVTYESYTVKLTAGRYSYFNFLPYKYDSLGAEDSQEIQDLLDKAEAAATGKYTITFTTATTAASIKMYKYAGACAVMPIDDEGIPKYVVYETGDGQPETTENSITLNQYSEIVRGDSVFGLLSDKDCTVTITVTRVGDADEPVQPDLVEVPVTGTPTAWPEADSSSTLTLMPVSGVLSAVFNEEDGFYHVGSETGPVLLINLTDLLERVGDFSIKDLPSNNPIMEAVYYFNGTQINSNNEEVPVRWDFNNLIATYSSLANSDGVYGVNADLYNFLQYFGVKTYTAVSPDTNNTNWLIPCQYYMPSGGLESEGEGSLANPYILVGGANGIGASGISSTSYTYLSFTATSDGLYSFSTSSGIINYIGANSSITKDGVLYIAMVKGDVVTPYITGTTSITTVTVGNETVLTPVFETGYIDNGDGTTTSVDQSQGTQNRPISVNSLGLRGYKVDSSVSSEGTYIKLNFSGSGRIVLDLGNSSSAAIIYNDKTYTGNNLVLNVVANTDYVLLLTAFDGDNNVKDGIYLLNITLSTAKVLEYDTENTLTFNDSYSIVEYSFDVPADGWYKIELPANTYLLISKPDADPFVSYSNLKDPNDEYIYSDSFYASEGETIVFSISYQNSITSGTATQTLKIIQGDEPVLTLDTEYTIQTKNGSPYVSNINAETEGTYSIIIKGDAVGSSNITLTVGEASYNVTVSEDETEYVAVIENLTSGKTPITISTDTIKGITLTIEVKQGDVSSN